MGKSRFSESQYKVGDWVEVLSKAEILATLDGNGCLDGMPFMPEMLAFCGSRFQVYKSAHKTCDTVFPVRSRRVMRSLHLETRCDGAAHGGCQAGCLLFWKDAWVKPVEGPDAPGKSPSSISQTAGDKRLITVADLLKSTQEVDAQSGKAKYVCQATRLPYFTEDLAWWDLRQYIEDYRTGNVGLREIMRGLAYSFVYQLSIIRFGPGRAVKLIYDILHYPIDGSIYPRRVGKIPAGKPTPTGTLNLQPGEMVRVKSHKEILSTLNVASQNRGMTWDAEMVPFCGGTYRVLQRVTRIVNERTGEMMTMKNPCIILDTVVCKSKYSFCRMYCPRAIYPYWREIWLERVWPAQIAAETGRQVDADAQERHEVITA